MSYSQSNPSKLTTDLNKQYDDDKVEEIIRRIAYNLWKRGFSEDANTNWYEAERIFKLNFLRNKAPVPPPNQYQIYFFL